MDSDSNQEMRLQRGICDGHLESDWQPVLKLSAAKSICVAAKINQKKWRIYPQALVSITLAKIRV